MTKILKKVLLALACLTLMTISSHASATNIYIAQSSAGAANGADCADAKPVSFFNASGNWGSGSAQIGPGTTVHLCGTFTGAAGSTMLTIQGSGASGSPVTILFESGAQLNAPYWGGDPFGGGPGAITCRGQSYVTIDGGMNGIVQNTANGTGLANQVASTGVFVSSCPHFTVQGHLTIQNIYVSSDGDPNGSGADLWVEYSDAMSITGATLTSAFVPLNIGYGGGATINSGTIANNTIDYGCHLFVVGDSDSNASINGLLIHDNVIGPHTEAFNQSTSGCHQDGLFLQSSNNGSVIKNFQIYNNWIKSDMCSNRTSPGLNCTGPVFYSSNAGTIMNTSFFNNIVQYVASAGGYEAMIRIDGGDSGNSFYNNVIDQNNAPQGQSCDCSFFKFSEYSGQTQSGFVFENNILLNDGGHGGYYNDDGNGLAFPSKLSTVDHDLYYGISGKYGFDTVSSQSYSTLAQWQSAGYDMNGIYSNPQLSVSYTPQSTLTAMGQNLTGLGDSSLDHDKAGVTRPSSGGWFPGAYQTNTSGAPAPPAGLVATVQ